MRKRLAVAVAAVCALGLAGPASASAECNTTVSCAVERVNTTVADTVATVNKTVADTLAIVNQKVEEAKALVAKTRDETLARANAGVHECVIMARINPDGTGTGTADCVRRYVNESQVRVTHGTVAIQGANVTMGPTGPVLRFGGAVNPIIITQPDVATAVTKLTDYFATAGGLSLHFGEYTGAGPARTAIAAFHTHAGNVLGADGDWFINGSLTLEGAV